MHKEIMKEGTSKKNRAIRIFISSTFRDMHEEREELVKRIFPQLRKLCESRGVVWGEVDLRWGVTDEEKTEGKVLPICLAEIQRCRPYFIGLLGERYGSIPREIPQELIEQERWLEEYIDHSLTELEILHGVLRDPRMADHSFFYFRDPAYIHHLAQSTDLSDYLPENETAKVKLSRLKDKIRQSGLPVRENYSDPRALGQLVLQDLTDVINKLYPEGSQPNPLDRDAADHEAFLQSRARVYIGREKYFKQLYEHAEGDGSPLVILGESGSGKSALIANWAIQYRTAHPDTLLILHFIGASPYSSEWAAMLRRIMGELKRKFGIQQEIPDKTDELRSAFANWLHMAAAKGKVVLILDALNQLEDREGALDLVWLPPVIPTNVRLILSTLLGRPLDDLKKRQWPQLEIQPFTLDERKLYIEQYLSQYKKSLNNPQAEKIAAREQTSNPLYLQALLEELRVFGRHEKLDQWIDHYLEADTIPELYERILSRYEQDYEQERPRLVRDAMSYLWAARRGLTEAELLDMLGSDGQPLPSSYWSPFYFVVESVLVNRSGLIGFFHNYLREAVQHRYSKTEESQDRSHLCLADFFDKRGDGLRRIDELPWQLSEAKAWQRLVDLLVNSDFFLAAWMHDKFDVQTYWATIERSSFIRIEDAFEHLLAHPESFGNADHVWALELLFYARGNLEQANTLTSFLISHFKDVKDLKGLRAMLGNQALIFFDRGKLDEALKLHKEEENICRQLGISGLSNSLNNQAKILYHWGLMDEAMALQKEAELICRQSGNMDGLVASLNNQGIILYYRGLMDEAMALQKEVELICRQSGNMDGLAASLGNQAIILNIHGHFEEALSVHNKQAYIYRQLGDLDGLQHTLCNQAVNLLALCNFDEAMACCKEQELICRQLGNINGLGASLCNQGEILRSQGKLNEAMVLYVEEENICRQLGNLCGLSNSLNNQAKILYVRGEIDDAIVLLKEQERICKDIDFKIGLSSSLNDQALIFKQRGELTEALKLLKEEEIICREVGFRSGLSTSLHNQALILQDQGDLDGAMKLINESQLICRELGDKGALSKSLCEEGSILMDLGEFDRAMKLFKEVEFLCRELEDRETLSKSLCNQGLINRHCGRLGEAMMLFKEEEHICTELRDKDGLSRSFGNQALIMMDIGESDQAMKKLKDVECICNELGKKDGLAISLMNQAELLAKKSPLPEEALSLAEAAYRLALTYGYVKLVEHFQPIMERIQMLKQGNINSVINYIYKPNNDSGSPDSNGR